MPDAIEIRRVPPGADTGAVVCRICGHTWRTTPDQDALLAEIFAHEQTHRPGVGTSPSSVDPPISTR
jgi:hypothetical protein